jgi:hypothetical protein
MTVCMVISLLKTPYEHRIYVKIHGSGPPYIYVHMSGSSQPYTLSMHSSGVMSLVQPHAVFKKGHLPKHGSLQRQDDGCHQ